MLGHRQDHHRQVDHLAAGGSGDLGVGQRPATTSTNLWDVHDNLVRVDDHRQRLAITAGLLTRSADLAIPGAFRSASLGLARTLGCRITRRRLRRVPRVLGQLGLQPLILSPQLLILDLQGLDPG